jgi:acetylglutamate kinase
LIVVKFGGSLIDNMKIRSKFFSGLIRLFDTHDIILVHGGGNDVNFLLKKFDLKSKFVDGLRFTDANVINVVEMVLNGKVNGALVNDFVKKGVKAVGISGKDGNSVICKRIKKVGFVGEPIKINKNLISILIKNKFLPVMASIATDIDGNVVNVNADTFAASIAVAFGARKLIFLTDVAGVLDVNKNLIKEIRINEIENLINNNIIIGGMIPKIKGCAKSVENGVKEVWITDDVNGITENINGTVIKV